MNRRRNRRSFRPSLDVLPGRITPCGFAAGPVMAMDVPVNSVSGIYATGLEPSGYQFPPVTLPPCLAPSLPEEPGLVDPQQLDPLAPTLPS